VDGSSNPVAGPRATGRVVDASGKGVAGARVVSIPNNLAEAFTLADLGGADAPALSTTTDAEGHFVVPLKATAPYHAVLATAEGFTSHSVSDVAPGGDVTIVLDAAASVAGTIRDADGKVVPSARVRILDLAAGLATTLEARS